MIGGELFSHLLPVILIPFVPVCFYFTFFTDRAVLVDDSIAGLSVGLSPMGEPCRLFSGKVCFIHNEARAFLKLNKGWSPFIFSDDSP